MSQRSFISLFAGIGGFDLALSQAGASSACAVEIDAQCNSVRRRHWPDEEQHTDVSAFSIRSTDRRPDIVCAGWPCQGNSVAGKRGGMADERSGLWGEVRRLLGEFSPSWFFGENVPGILSVNGGRDWAAVLGDLAELGYGFAYRILDAQWFGVAQRRRRVFVVGHLGDWRRAAEVLFESESLPWNPTPSRQAGSRVAASLTRGTDSGGRGGYAGRRQEDDYNLAVNCLDRHMGAGGPDDNAAQANHLVAFGGNNTNGPIDVATACNAHGGTGRHDFESETFIACDPRQITSPDNRSNPLPEGPCHTLHEQPPAVAYQCHGSNVGPMGTVRAGNGNETGGVPFTVQAAHSEGSGPHARRADISKCIDGHGGNPDCNNGGTAILASRVRRLTPRECERLQGFPDDWTRYGHDGKEISDSARYRMIGNSVAVPCVAWIARRMMAQR